jgi:hypothetical protein
MGGHVIFSHYLYFDQLLEAACGELDDDSIWNTLQRVSYVRMLERWVAYPFQNNIAALPVEEQIACLEGMVDATKASATLQAAPANFDEVRSGDGRRPRRGVEGGCARVCVCVCVVCAIQRGVRT